MSNWDYVTPYDECATEYLTEEGLPHPTITPGNRAPTVRELASIDPRRCASQGRAPE